MFDEAIQNFLLMVSRFNRLIIVVFFNHFHIHSLAYNWKTCSFFEFCNIE